MQYSRLGNLRCVFKKQMGWKFNGVSSHGTNFNRLEGETNSGVLYRQQIE